MDRIHCIWARDIDTKETFDFCDHSEAKALGKIEDGVDLIDNAAILVGHNVLHFDIPAVQKLYPTALEGLSYFSGTKRFLDTILLARLIWPDIKVDDWEKFGIFEIEGDKKRLVATKHGFPPKHIGRYGLEAFGYRLGLLKDDYTARCKANGVDPWKAWNSDMHAYCLRDIEVNEKLLDLIRSKKYSQAAMIGEHRFAEVIRLQELHGFPFDVDKAEALKRRLMVEKASLEDELQQVFKPWEIHSWFTPKVNNKKLGYEKGVPFRKTLVKVFNPGSRQHIEDRLRKLRKWRPLVFTKTGQAKIDETTLAHLPWPEVALLTRFLLLEKRLGQIAEGNQAWLNLVTPAGRIHGRVTTIGAVTRRVTHQRPNMSATPKVTKPYGEECRELFIAPEGWLLVGCDGSSFQPRLLGHYMARWDGGAFAEEILKVKLYIAVMNKAPKLITSPEMAKTFILALLFGAKANRIAKIIKGTKEQGQHLLNSFLNNLPALRKLRELTSNAFKSPGYLVTLDGGRLTLRDDYLALNTLLQGAEAVLMKWAVCRFFELTLERGLIFGRDWALVGFFHDEVQFLARPHLAKELGALMADCIRQAGEHFKLRIPLAGEFKVGANWKETH